MAAYRLLKHKDYDSSVRKLPPSIQQKALWAQVLLGTRGRTPSVKGTTGFELRWRRTPVQGNHFYMWWIPQSESGLATNETSRENDPSILIHSVRHHDATSEPIAPGYLDDYHEVHVADLDPRFAEQRMVARQLDGTSIELPKQQRPISLATVKGLPGSGKTISLLYLVRDLLHRTDKGNILYITYTARLKRAAEEFLLAQDASFAERVQLKTLNEVQSEFTGITSPPESFRALDDFCKFLNLQNTSTLGPWRRYPQALYTEIRAHLLGRDFPPDFSLLGQKVGDISTRLEPLDARSYAKMRKLDLETAEIAQKVSVRATASRFFREQQAAKRALEILLSGRMPPWLANVSGLLVDEVQDLTLLQIALLGEMVKTAVDVQGRYQSNSPHRGPFANTPFVFTVAGDESQIVQPTGFDWGVTKDLLAKQLDVHPSEYEFQHQRRSPRVLANLVENSWNFYSFLPKSHRPSARRDAFVDESVAADHQYEDGGRVLLCGDLEPSGSYEALSASTRTRNAFDLANRYVESTQSADWFSLFEEMVDKPGRILIDLTEKLRSVLSESTQSISDEVLFLPREIKGLERANVIIYGLNAIYERAMLLCDNENDDNVPRFEARRLFDEVRVALSRSTNTLVLLEPPTAPVLPHLQIDELALATPDVEVVLWGDLIDILRTEEMSELEAIERYLDEVEDLIERERWEQAYQRNRRAYALAVEIMDKALQQEADSQHIKIHLQEAAGLFAREDWATAYARNRESYRLALMLGAPQLLEQIDNQVQQFRSTLAQQARIQLEQAQSWLSSGSYRIALRDTKTALDLAEAIQDELLTVEVRQTTVAICTEWAYQLTSGTATANELNEAQSLLAEAIQILERSNQPEGTAWQVIAARYATIPQIGQLSTSQLPQVLAHIKDWAEVVGTQRTESSASGITFVLRWLDETYHSLGQQLVLYYEWAAAAELVIDLTAASDTADMFDIPLSAADFDEYLWDLEFRIELALEENPERSKRTQRGLEHFSAFMLGYNGEASAAARVWERLGNLPEAARQARKAGELELAYDLLRSAKAPIPEEVAISVKALRLLEQLATKHDGLNDAEKKALSKQLNVIQRTLSVEDVADDKMLNDGAFDDSASDNASDDDVWIIEE